MAETIDRAGLLDWIIDRIEKDAPGAHGQEAGASSVYFGRIDSLVMLGTDFELWSLETRDRIGIWIERPRGRRLREVLA
jgi:hypothetical protein